MKMIITAFWLKNLGYSIKMHLFEFAQYIYQRIRHFLFRLYAKEFPPVERAQPSGNQTFEWFNNYMLQKT